MTENHEIVVRQNSSRSQTPTPSNSLIAGGKKNKRKNGNKFNLSINLATKIIFIIFIIYLIIIVLKSISNDVAMEVERQNELDMKKIKQYEEEYIENKCSENKYPKLQEKCKLLKERIDAPRQGVGKSRIAVRYFANLLNELINPLSPKTVILFSLIVIFVVWFPKFL